MSGRLVGSVSYFDGDRSKTHKFEKEFGLYRMLNNNNPTVNVPFTRVALALTFIKGDKVDLWSQQYADYLAGLVYGINGQPPTHAVTDEALWNDFTTAFHRQFRDTAEHERA